MTLQNYKIWTNDGLIEKEDAGEMKHVDPQAAVVEFIEAYDQGGDFYFARNTSTDVVIFCEDEAGHITQWNVEVETVPQYYAKEVKPKAEPCCESPAKEKCDQCQETGTANPHNH